MRNETFELNKMILAKLGWGVIHWHVTPGLFFEQIKWPAFQKGEDIYYIDEKLTAGKDNPLQPEARGWTLNKAQIHKPAYGLQSLKLVDTKPVNSNAELLSAIIEAGACEESYIRNIRINKLLKQ